MDDTGEYEVDCDRPREEMEEESGNGQPTNSDSEDEVPRDQSWEAWQPPTIDAARAALHDINQLLKPLRPKGGGYKECRLPLQLRTRLEWVASLLHVYTDTKSKYGKGFHDS
jgi:hypothetical protein